MGRHAGGWEVTHKMRHAATRTVFRNHFSGIFRRPNDRLFTKEVELLFPDHFIHTHERLLLTRVMHRYTLKQTGSGRSDRANRHRQRDSEIGLAADAGSEQVLFAAVPVEDSIKWLIEYTRDDEQP